MIEFLTLFLGLVTDVQPVEFAVSPEVATLEVRLDGEVVDELSEEPWTCHVDFGTALEPHELEAVAFDETGRELHRLTQSINLAPHQSDSTPSTALLVRVDKGHELPSAEGMSSWFLKDGRPLEVIKVEKGTAEVVFLRDPEAPAFLEARSDPTYGKALSRRGRRLAAGMAQKPARFFANMGPGTTVRFVSPQAVAPSRVTNDRRIFHRSRHYAAGEGGFLWLTTTIPTVLSHFRLSDALAVSARQLHGSSQRRALVVLLVQPRNDHSLYAPPRVQSYLEQLQVPVEVWSLNSGDPHPDWGEVVDLRPDKNTRQPSWAPVGQATAALRERLDAQRVVWLRGRHLPRSIELSTEVRGIRLEGSWSDSILE